MSKWSQHFLNLRRRVAETILLQEPITFPEGGCRWTHHQQHPDRPLATFFISLRGNNNKGEKQGKLRPEDIELIAQLFVDMTRELDLKFDRICGIPNAGEPFAEAFIRLAGLDPGILLHLEKVGEGADKHFRIAGKNYRPCEIVLLLDDLINHSGTKKLALSTLSNAGLIIRDIVVLMDGQFGGSIDLRLQGINLHAAWNTRDLFGYAKIMGLLPDKNCDATQDFIASERLEMVLATQTHQRLAELHTILENM